MECYKNNVFKQIKNKQKLKDMKRKEIEKLLNKIDDLKMELECTIQDILNEREEQFDERSEKWQESENGERFTELSEEIESIKDDALYSIDEVMSRIDEITEL